MKYMQPEMEIVLFKEETIIRTSSTKDNDRIIFDDLEGDEEW